jgi:DNA-binding XRE family transcriptional regulator
VSSAEDWIAWARRKAEAANGRPADPGQQAAYGIRQGNTVRPEPAPLPQRPGDGQHPASSTGRQGNTGHGPPERQARSAHRDESDPRRPGDPPWRGRIAHRTSTPEAVAAFRNARRRRGWTLTRAAAETGVSRPHLSLLERGLRRPSESVAEAVITGYRMTDAEADAVSEIAVPWAGRDSPYRTGVAPGEW